MSHAAGLLVVSLGVIWAASASAADCNRNGLDDLEEIRSGLASDCNENEAPDECDTTATLVLQRTGEFSARRSAGITSIGTGDLNADGDVDVVATISETNEVWALFGEDGFSRYRSERLEAGISPHDTKLGDLDQDGDLDVVICNRDSNTISILQNRGDGSLREPIDIEVGRGPIAVTIADVNRDRLSDLVVVNAYSSDFAVLINRGNGEFELPLRYLTGSLPSAVTIGDVNGDGHPEIVITNSATGGDISVHFNEQADFSREVRYPLAGADDALLFDLREDGAPDLIVSREYSPGLSALINSGAGEFSEVQDLSLESCRRRLTAADLDADGDMDVIGAGSCKNGLVAYFNDGAEGLSAAFRLHGELVAHTIALDDVDSDGRIDVICGDRTTRNVLHFSNRSGDGPAEISFAAARKLAAGYDAGDRIEAADLDGDGITDLIVPQGETISLFRSPGSVANLSISASLPSSIGHVTTADVDADGIRDVVATLPLLGKVAVVRGLGGDDLDLPVLSSLDTVPERIAAADLDSDGDADLVASDADGNVYVLESRGDGSFAPSTGLPGAGTLLTHGLADLDGDSLPDLITSRAGRLSFFLNSGDMRFTHFVDLDAAAYVRFVLLGDLDSDGDTDVLTGGTRASMDAYANLGDLTFAEPTSIFVTGSLSDAALGDLNGDGIPDIVATTHLGSVVVLQNEGNFRFTTTHTASITTDRLSLGVEVGDFDGDEDTDIAIGQSASVGLVFFWNRTQAPVSPDANENGVPDECESLFIRGDCGAASAGLFSPATSAVFLLNYLFLEGPAPACWAACDVNADGAVDGSVTDALYLLTFGFLQGEPPPAPFPGCAPSAPSPTLDCESASPSCS